MRRRKKMEERNPLRQCEHILLFAVIEKLNTLIIKSRHTHAYSYMCDGISVLL